MQFTVFFDGQYWVGVLEVVDDDQLRAARRVFGAEPSGPELYEFALHDFACLAERARASCPVPADDARTAGPRLVNPKRTARLLARERAAPPISTAAQRALKESVTARAAERRVDQRQAREQERVERWAKARSKARGRRRGRS
jgi:hypothetical protein